jgi:hypothetical protein
VSLNKLQINNSLVLLFRVPLVVFKTRERCVMLLVSDYTYIVQGIKCDALGTSTREVDFYRRNENVCAIML